MNSLVKTKVVPCMMILFILISNAYADKTVPGWGRVNMQGAILYTACAISTGSREQSIDMGTMPVSEINRDGKGKGQSLSIELINCLVTSKKEKSEKQNYFSITFDGKSEGKAFGVSGEARGIALQITDLDGNIAVPGISSRMDALVAENMTLNYVMRLVSTDKSIRSGSYFSVIRFKLDYY